ncbi:HEAT repeat domain-containing protein [Lignipirellula cremea]|nr:HEAT repeat domain-containing protein [Lignipirellula cremea]
MAGSPAAFAQEAQEAQWIWAPEHKKDAVPQGSVYFRKTFEVANPESGEISIAADDNYELYVNSRKVAVGESARSLNKLNISQYLSRGRNLIAVRVNNTAGSTAAMVARVFIKERGGRWMNHSSNGTWKTALDPFPLWNMLIYSDTRWSQAQSFGALGSTSPWDRQESVAEELPEQHERFKVNREFKVERLAGHELTGSLIAMTFNEFGQILASREDGPLLLIADTNDDQIPDHVAVYCDKVKSCQGILAVNGEVYVIGDGPDGAGLYRCGDYDGDSKLETVRTVIKFKGPLSEHGPHGLALGHDGFLYMSVGNHSSIEGEYDPKSPYRHSYEGDIVPRYEDPGGHAAGVKAPGGVILRSDLDGKKVEVVAGGFRNAYDLAFNREGDLFTHDSDMESDMGASWYRPTLVHHVVPGGEYGWRSGWSKWPEYYPDTLPAIVDTGRGSPTGAVVYDHHMFPVRFQNALFLADWSEGRIIAVRMKKDGASYATQSETFLQGEPLNVTDLEVGPDGGLYFTTGGRGTGGGIYRVSWRGEVPEGLRDLGEGLSEVIRQPQLQSAWSRQRIASLKAEFGDTWGTTLAGVARSDANPSRYRTRALNLMQLFGPFPSTDLLVTLSQEKNEEVRAKAAELMGMHPTKESQTRLQKMLDDVDRTVRRKACEALLRANQTASLTQLTACLVSDDRFESYVARRLLERLPEEQYRERILKTSDQRLFIEGSLALMLANPSRKNGIDVLERSSEMIEGFVSDRNFTDLMRVMQVAITRGDLKADDAPRLREQLAVEFPSGNSLMNRELMRLLAFFQASSPMDRYLDFIEGDAPEIDKLHVALHLRFIEPGWNSAGRMRLLRYYAKARKREDGGGSFPFYVSNVSRDFARSLAAEDIPEVLAQAEEWPEAALAMLYKLPHKIDDSMLDLLIEVDEKMAQADSENLDVKKLKIGIAAVLARSGDPASMKYLRDMWDRDPERRKAIALGLATQPSEENWPYLVKSLSLLDAESAKELMKILAEVDVKPHDAKPYRDVILKGLELEKDGARETVALLEHWSGEQMSAPEDAWDDAMGAWQIWYKRRFPEGQTAKLPSTSSKNTYSFEELTAFLATEQGQAGSADRGAVVYKTAQCAKCHRHGGQGDSIGPDLTGVAKRFTRREILESIVFPSHVISDQYASKTILTVDGKQTTGMVVPGAAGTILVLQADGKKKEIAETEIDDIIPSKVSAMPEGLLNDLSLEEITDLMTFLIGPNRTVIARQPK